jgi:hypothetical protein
MGWFSKETPAMNKHRDIINMESDEDFFKISIYGKIRRFDLQKISPVLNQATETEKQTFEGSPSGYGIHWPLLDEDISINALLGIASAPSNERKTA